MKNLVLLATLIAASLGFSSCCSMFGIPSFAGNYRTVTKQVKTCGYDIVTEQVMVPGDSKSGKGGMVQTVEKKVPRYKTVTSHVAVHTGPCVHHYCPTKDKCGTTSESTMRMASVQGSSGSPNFGLIPTMRVLPIGPSVTAP